MQYTSLSDFMSRGRDALVKGPIALIFVEDQTEIDSTIRHHLDAGFKAVIVFMPRHAHRFDEPFSQVVDEPRLGTGHVGDQGLQDSFMGQNAPFEFGCLG